MGSRNTVLWVGQAPDENFLTELESRQLSYRNVAFHECASIWNSARAVVFRNPSDADFAGLCDGGLQAALSHGVTVRIVVPFGELKARRLELRGIPAGGNTWLLMVDGQYDMAEDFARYDPGPAHDRSVILLGDHKLSGEESVLLQRAFHDCSEVHLQQMPDGTASVFLAYAKLKDSRVGPYPLPLFVKIDKRERAERERLHYGECTTAFVPFYARPNLHLSRCLMGAQRGIIVGDFVERSEGLLELVKRGVAHSVIDSLFQDALRGWRAQPYGGSDSVVLEKLGFPCLPKDVLSRKSELLTDYSSIAKSYGSRLSAFEVVSRLDALPPIRYRRGWTHGDLHCANVRARAGEAILIDFQSVGAGALSTDPATLDVSMALEFESDEVQWRLAMDEMYRVDNLRTVPRPREPVAPLHALWEALRQIRRYGLAEQVDEHEYCRAVAVQLIRKAAHRRNPREQMCRRPYLIKLAADIVEALEALGGSAHRRLAEVNATHTSPA